MFKNKDIFIEKEFRSLEKLHKDNYIRGKNEKRFEYIPKEYEKDAYYVQQKIQKPQTASQKNNGRNTPNIFPYTNSDSLQKIQKKTQNEHKKMPPKYPLPYGEKSGNEKNQKQKLYNQNPQKKIQKPMLYDYYSRSVQKLKYNLQENLKKAQILNVNNKPQMIKIKKKEEIKERPEVKNSTQECIICCDQPREMIGSCFHISMCIRCSQKMNCCPVCKKQTKWNKVYFP